MDNRKQISENIEKGEFAGKVEFINLEGQCYKSWGKKVRFHRKRDNWKRVVGKGEITFKGVPTLERTCGHRKF